MRRFLKIFLLGIFAISVEVQAQYCHTDFESQPVGTAYERSVWHADGFQTATWDNGLATRTMVDNSTSVSGTKSLRITYPANTFGPSNNGAQIPLLVTPSEELYMSYWIRFSENFTWGTTNYGGKIPGIAGGDNCSGGSTCDGTNGFSCRFMWRTGGRLGLYEYDMNKTQTYGVDYELFYPNGDAVKVERGKWMHIAERVKINSSASASDGEVEVWVNGEQVLFLGGRKFVTNDDLPDKLYISTFHGGDDATWCPTETCYIWFDDIKISTRKSDVEYKNCSKPNLGVDRTLCGSNSVELQSGISNATTVCTWVKNGEILGTGNSFTVTEAGQYIVNADSLGCSRKDTIQILANVQPNLGNDISICKTSFVTLDANVEGESLLYEWKRNNSVIDGETSRTLRIKDAGIYSVTVSSPACATVTSQVSVSSGLLEIADIKAEPNQNVTLQIVNPAETTYDWFSAETEGELLHSGNSFTTNSGDKTTTYYVADRNGFSGYVGKKTIAEKYTENRYDRRMKFQVFRNLTIDSITVYLVGEQDVVISILDESQSQIIFTKTFAGLPAGENRLGISAELMPATYYMSGEGSTGRLYISYEADTDIHFPYTVDGVISILGSNTAWIDAKPYYLFFYNWRVSTGNYCARTPATVIVPEAIPALQTQTINLQKGWNIMSINLHSSDSSIQTLFSGLDVNLIKDEDGFWWKNNSTELQSLTALTAGKGYLVQMNQVGTLTVSGTAMTDTKLKHRQGWNLIGVPFQTDTPIESVFDANNCQILKNLNGTWQPSGANNSLENMEPGSGYFVK